MDSDYEIGWADCKNSIIELLHSFTYKQGDLVPTFDFLTAAQLDYLSFAIAAQEPNND